MSAPRRLIVIVNSAAGDEGKRELADGLMPVFADHGFDSRLVMAGDGSEMDSVARDAVRCLLSKQQKKDRKRKARQNALRVPYTRIPVRGALGKLLSPLELAGCPGNLC